MLVFALSFLALAAPVPDSGALDRWDIDYLVESSRGEQTHPTLFAKMAEEPDEVGWVATYLSTLVGLPSHRSPALVGLAEAWRDARPGAGDAGVLVARAHALSAYPPGITAFGGGAALYPGADGTAWCDAAVDALSTLPADPMQRYNVIRERLRLAGRCGIDAEAARSELEELALSGEAGASRRAWFGVADGVDAEDLAALREALDEEPCRAGSYLRYFGDDTNGDVEPARAALLDAARAIVTSDRPARAFAAARVFEAAGQTAEAIAAYERVVALDSANTRVPRIVERLRTDAAGGGDPGAHEAVTAGQDAPSPEEMLEPEARLAALKATRQPPRSGWQRLVYWAARADAAEAAGDTEDALDSLDELWRYSGTTAANLRFASLAVASGERLGAARRAMVHALAIHRRARPYSGDPEAGERWRTGLARALVVQAGVLHARGDRRKARKNLEEAVLLAPPSSGALLALGLIYAEDGDHGRAHPALGAGLALHRGDPDEGTERALALLAESLREVGMWAPGGPEGYVAALRAHGAAQRAAATEPSAPSVDVTKFAELEVDIGDERQKLFDVQGPLVIDLWATWCGPCKQSLPHLDALARRYDGQVTFVAVSVDDTPQQATAYLRRRGEPAFTAAYAGPGALKALGVNGIPAMWVFDADHRMVAELHGWGPDSTRLDEAIAAMLGR